MASYRVTDGGSAAFGSLVLKSLPIMLVQEHVRSNHPRMAGRLSPYHEAATLVEVGGEEGALREALAAAGFEDMSIWHWLGVRTTQALVRASGKEAKT